MYSAVYIVCYNYHCEKSGFTSVDVLSLLSTLCAIHSTTAAPVLSVDNI